VTVTALLAELHDRDIHVWPDGEHLRCNAPSGALTDALRERLRANKRAIVAFLRSAESASRQPRAIVPLQNSGRRPPIFGVGGHNGDVFCYRALARCLGEDQPFFGLEPPGLDPAGEPLGSVGDLADYFAGQVRAFKPEGPCVIAGYCAGGAIAFELGRRLLLSGTDVRFVALFAGRFPTWFRPLPQLFHRVARYADRATAHRRALAPLSPVERARYLRRLWHRVSRRPHTTAPAVADPALAARRRLQETTMHAIHRYAPGYLPGRLVLFLPSPRSRRAADGLLGWRTAAFQVAEYCGPEGCEGDDMLLEPHVGTIAGMVRQCMDQEAAHAHLP
jgi:thioesterase domain-containing protein